MSEWKVQSDLVFLRGAKFSLNYDIFKCMSNMDYTEMLVYSKHIKLQ